MTTKFKVPLSIIEDIKTRFPEVETSEIEWSWEVPNKILEAEITHEGIEYELEYSISGLLISIESYLEISEIPTAVVNAVESQFPGAEIHEAERVEYSNGVIHIELDINHEDKDFEAHYREDGTLVLTGDDL
jgi:hypothetical protein